ncbi:MAG: hypothetical protein IJV01_08270 [Bacteroidales bacterium]|nr:hypothetical protein [Bacteroidales bacterium]
MDIGLLSKMVGELIPERDEVGLPGLGSFVAEWVPASFSDRGYTINPPYRRMTFLPGRSDDSSLVELYAASNGIDFDQAKALLQHFLEEIKKELMERKTVAFPGLGRLRATRENRIFFICDEALDIYPGGFGLEPISLKTHQAPAEPQPAEEPAPEAVAAEEVPAAEAPAPAADAPAAEASAVEAPAADAPAAPAAEPAPAAENPAPRRRWWLLPLLLVLLAALALAVFVLLAHVAPDFIDSILYTPEELRIING